MPWLLVAMPRWPNNKSDWTMIRPPGRHPHERILSVQGRAPGTRFRRRKNRSLEKDTLAIHVLTLEVPMKEELVTNSSFGGLLSTHLLWKELGKVKVKRCVLAALERKHRIYGECVETNRNSFQILNPRFVSVVLGSVSPTSLKSWRA